MNMLAGALLDLYERFLHYTLIPSVFVLMAIIFLDGLNVWAPPQMVFYGFMTHYLGGVLYSMVRQSRQWGPNA